MSCEYCTGDKLLCQLERTEMLDGKPWDLEANTKIARGHYLGTAMYANYMSVGGTSVKINYCPICGEDLRYDFEK